MFRGECSLDAQSQSEFVRMWSSYIARIHEVWSLWAWGGGERHVGMRRRELWANGPLKSHPRERSEKTAILKGHCRENYEVKDPFKGHCRERWEEGYYRERSEKTGWGMGRCEHRLLHVPDVLTAEYDNSLSPAVLTLCSHFDRCKWQWNQHDVQKISLSPHTPLVDPDTNQLKHRFISVTTQYHFVLHIEQ
jgi:hypothetical protein